MASDSLTHWVIVTTDSPSGYMAAAIHRLQPAAWEHGGAMILDAWAPPDPAAQSIKRASCSMGPGRAEGRRGPDWEVSRTIFYFFKLTSYPMGSANLQLHKLKHSARIRSTMESLNPDPVGANVTMTGDNTKFDQPQIELPDWLDPAPRTLAKSPPAVKSLVLTQYEHVFMRVIDEVAHGKSLSQVLNDDQRHIDYNDFYRWIKKDPTRKQLFDEAQEMRTEFMAGEIIEIADADDTLEDVNRSRLKIDTRKWLMGAHNRKKYGATTNIEMSGGISILAALEAANARVIDLADVTDVQEK